MGFPPVQAAPSFASSFQHLFPGKDNNLRCLIPCAIDQGVNGKMSASNPNSAIYVTDTTKDIKKKVNSAFSGGKDNSTEQENAGADLEVDIPFKYLSFFLDDAAELEHIKKEYGEGRMLSGAVKQLLGPS
ncbi:BnaC07g48040D [Brassica napus]|uniref:Tryptophanyl-tRNA synthetase n=2 Tax=Brassica TaxID=3705 RepID=A0A078JEG9_BRANA|nr:BnaC07g48040D [Brassica napus]